MSRRNQFRNKKDEVQEVDVTTFLNLMVVLIPFLLATAVFSNIAIQELNLPAAGAAGGDPDKPIVTIEVMVREDKLEIANGEKITNTFKKIDDQHDIKSLSLRLQELKAKHPEKDDATILAEPDIDYQDLIAVMDAVKVAEIKRPDLDEMEKKTLFPKLSLGDAP